MNKKTLLSDIFLILPLLALGVAAVLLIGAFRDTGVAVKISQNGETVGEYSLTEDGEYILADGGNILVIENGYAYIRYADCPDGLCVKMGKISKAGERIICLPNRIAVEIVG